MLLDGTPVLTCILRRDEKRRIAHIEDLIARHDDYFRVFHEAFVGICATMPHTADKEHAMTTRLYVVLTDVVERYRRKTYFIDEFL